MPAPRLKHENVTAIARQSLVLLQTAHPEISFTFDVPKGPITVNCDAQQVGQAITNLLQNAVDSLTGQRDGDGAEKTKDTSNRKGAISLSLSATEGDVAIVIQDNGSGLPLDLIHRLTEPYVTTREKGTGLGLAIVRKIMDDHEGRLKLENAPEGGARISLILPLAEPDSEDGSNEGQSSNEQDAAE